MFGLFKKKPERPHVAAVIAAGGSSTRMKGGNKLLAEVAGMPVLAHTLRAFEANGNIDEIVIVAREDLLLDYADLARTFEISKVSQVVSGGASRAESVYKGVCACGPDCAYVLVHDGARPLVTAEVIDRVVEKTIETGCAAAVVPVNDTIRVIDPDTGAITLADRSRMRAMQTPQGSDRQLLAAALKNCIDKGITATDDCAALEALGAKPELVDGSFRNIKITTAEDLAIAAALFEEEI